MRQTHSPPSFANKVCDCSQLLNDRESGTVFASSKPFNLKVTLPVRLGGGRLTFFAVNLSSPTSIAMLEYLPSVSLVKVSSEFRPPSSRNTFSDCASTLCFSPP